MTYQRVKGTEDFYPEEQGRLDALFSKLDAACRAYGFLHVEPPILESFKLLSAKSGDEIKEQIFMLEKRGDEELSLRPEFTPGFARMLVAKQRELPKPVKWYTINRVWRYEAPQKGRSREFYQLNVELYGSPRPEADAEIINLAIACLKSTGLTAKDFVVKLNNRKLVQGLLDVLAPKESQDAIMRAIDKSKKISEDELLRELKNAGLTADKAEMVKKLISMSGTPDKLSAAVLNIGTNAQVTEGLAELEKVFSLVDSAYATVDLSIVRGLAYYTGLVFEAQDRDGKLRSIAGGGRYDNLIGTYGGESMPATGFAIGDKVLSIFLAEKGLTPALQLGPDVYVAPVDEKVYPEALACAQELRASGVRCDIDLLGRKLAKQFDYANSIGAKFVIIVGEKDLATGNITLRDLAAGAEEKIPRNKIAETLRQMIHTRSKKSQ